MDKTQINSPLKEIILKARIVSFSTWTKTHPELAIQYFQSADDDKRFLTSYELAQITALSPSMAKLTQAAQLLADQAKEIVDEARTKTIETFPAITEEGGDLFPADRALSCWRDFWHFLRCITYGIAGNHLDYTSSEGLYFMEILYHELKVPLPAMIFGLKSVKTSSLKRLDLETQRQIAPYFDTLIDCLGKFSLTEE